MKDSLDRAWINGEYLRKLVAEGLGTLLLVAAVVGSGIMAERLAAGNDAVALLANTFATSAMLVILIMIFAPLSGAHFNPLVSLVMALRGDLAWREFPGYGLAQLLGGIGGVMLAHGMFELPLVTLSLHERNGMAQMISEAVATFGLVSVILGCIEQRKAAIPYTVAAYIGSAYWFTASTSFANPVVTVARALTDTFSGIRPLDVPAFIVAQVVGGLLAMWLWGWFYPRESKLGD